MYRAGMEIPDLSVTDTDLACGYFGVFGYIFAGYYIDDPFSSAINTYLLESSSLAPPALAILEASVVGDGKSEPFSPLMSTNIVEIPSTRESSYIYNRFRAKRFIDKIAPPSDSTVLQIDSDAVSWGAFELHPDKSPTTIIIITRDNLYKTGAIQRQIDFAKSKNLRVFSPPRDYSEAVELYNKLKKDYPHWLAGKDNFAYQTLGWEIFGWMQNIDFYYGELLEHKTHYQQLKQVSDKEITSKLNELIDKLNRETILVDEKDKHISKAKEILKRGW
jgi:hypothetical protein